LLSQNIAFNKIDSDRNARGAKFWYLMVQVLQHLKQKWRSVLERTEIILFQWKRIFSKIHLKSKWFVTKQIFFL